MRDPPLILAVDDRPENLEILSVRLGANGYEVETAGDGEEGLRRARELQPDLILLDIMMPKLDGIAVVRELKKDPALRAIPVIAVTSYALSGDEAKTKAAGCDGYVAKPFSPRQLLAKINEFLP